MSYNIFLTVDGIKGESRDETYRDAIDVLSISWGVSNPANVMTPGRSSSRSEFSDFNLMKSVDRASPQLFLKCAAGTVIPWAQVDLVRAMGDTAQAFLKYRFEQVVVTSLQHSGATGGDTRPTESASLGYARVFITYREQRADGTLGPETTVGWDVAKNQPIA